MAKVQFLKAKWLNLLMLNYEVDPAILKPYLPAATELDMWQGKALVSMVGFLFADTRVLGIKWPWHINFEEVNLRFYVRHFDGKDWKRGAVFISEIVPKVLIAEIANRLYQEHYRTLPMRHSIVALESNKTRYLYEWKLRGKWNRLGGTVGHELKKMQPGSAEEFIFEHYWGYNSINETITREYQVEHVSWKAALVNDVIFEADVAELYGEQFVPYLSKAPYSAFFADGSDIAVRISGRVSIPNDV